MRRDHRQTRCQSHRNKRDSFEHILTDGIFTAMKFAPQRQWEYQRSIPLDTPSECSGVSVIKWRIPEGIIKMWLTEYSLFSWMCRNSCGQRVTSDIYSAVHFVVFWFTLNDYFSRSFPHSARNSVSSIRGLYTPPSSVYSMRSFQPVVEYFQVFRKSYNVINVEEAVVLYSLNFFLFFKNWFSTDIYNFVKFTKMK